MKIIKTCLLAVILCFSVSGTALADYFVWQSAKTGVSLTFPDTWKIVSNKSPDDLVTVMAPSGRAHAACRMRARDDRRFEIYPPHYDAAIQQVGYSYDYMAAYLGEYDESEVLVMRNGAGLGRGYASYAIVSYEGAVQGPYMPRKALVFIGLYDNRVHILECSAHRDGFDQWQDLFLSIAGSVNYRKAGHETMTGHYRNFLGEERIIFDGTTKNSRILY